MVGGRGKKAPYLSTHCRIPDPIKKIVERLSSTYRDFIANGRDTQELLEVVEASIHELTEPFQGTKYREKALRIKLAKVEADRDRQLIRISELQNRHIQEVRRIYDEAEKKNEILEKYNREIDRMNGYLEAENRRLRDQLYSFKHKQSDQAQSGEETNDGEPIIKS
jgi:hypothetical protein